MKQVEVSILGHVYLLGCPEGGEALLATAVAAVDREMTSIREAGKVKARERIAVLAALNVAYQLAERETQMAASAAVGRRPPEMQADSSFDIEAMLRRIDAALGDDGQLL